MAAETLNPESASMAEAAPPGWSYHPSAQIQRRATALLARVGAAIACAAIAPLSRERGRGRISEGFYGRSRVWRGYGETGSDREW